MPSLKCHKLSVMQAFCGAVGKVGDQILLAVTHPDLMCYTVSVCVCSMCVLCSVSLCYTMLMYVAVSMCPMLMIKSIDYFEQLEDLRSPGTPTTPQHHIKPMGLWDPRADDDRLIVTCIRLVGSELLVGFQGGHCLLLKPNNQSATCTVKVGVSFTATPVSHVPCRQLKLL